MPSNYRNKNTKVRYAEVQDPQDPSGLTKARTEKGVSWFTVKTDSLEFAPLDLVPTETVEADANGMAMEVGTATDSPSHRESETEHQTLAPYGAVFHEPMTVEHLAQRQVKPHAAPDEFDYIVLSRQLPYNLGEAVRHLWLSQLVDNEESRQYHLRSARFHTADEMQRSR